MATDASSNDTGIDDRALDSLSVAPAADGELEGKDQEAGQDASIAERLQQDPSDVDAQLDNGLDESMDASDPVSTTQPSTGNEPAPSSGYDADAEAARKPS